MHESLVRESLLAFTSAEPPGTNEPPAGLEYQYDEENRVVAIYRDFDGEPGPYQYGTVGPPLEESPESEHPLYEFKYDALGRRVETVQYVDEATGQRLVDDGDPPAPAPRRIRHVYAGLETIQEYEYCSGEPESSACCLIEENPLCRQADGYALAREFVPARVAPRRAFVRSVAVGDGFRCAKGGASRVKGDANRFPEPLAMIDNTPLGGALPGQLETFYFLHDALGSVVGLVHGGEIVERNTFDPYGRVVVERPVDPDGPAQGDPCEAGCAPAEWVANVCGGGAFGANALCYSAFGNPFMWTGQRYDAVTGTYHFHYRTYSPGLGRWLQRDPAGYVDGVNLYEYARGNAAGYVDPLGLLSASSSPMPPSAEGKPSDASSTKPCPEDDDCLKRATKKAHDDKNDLEKNEGYNSMSNDHKIFHCLESCHSVKECAGKDASKLKKLAVAAHIGIGGIGYEILRGIGVSPPNMKKSDEGGHGWEISSDDIFDRQHPAMWIIDTAGDLVANAIGIAAALAGKDCKDACRSAHNIPGPDYTAKGWVPGQSELESDLNGRIVPIRRGRINRPNP